MKGKKFSRVLCTVFMLCLALLTVGSAGRAEAVDIDLSPPFDFNASTSGSGWNYDGSNTFTISGTGVVFTGTPAETATDTAPEITIVTGGNAVGWQAVYSGATTNSTSYLITVSDGGAFNVTAGSIIATGDGGAIQTTGNVTVSGGATVEAKGAGSAIKLGGATSQTVTVIGPVSNVTASGAGNAILCPGTATVPTIVLSAGGKIEALGGGYSCNSSYSTPPTITNDGTGIITGPIVVGGDTYSVITFRTVGTGTIGWIATDIGPNIGVVGSFLVDNGNSITFAFRPGDGSSLTGVTNDGDPFPSPYQITNIAANHIITATFTFNGGDGGGGGGGGWTPSSNVTTPTEISVTLSETQYKAELQPDGTYLAVLPAGTDPAVLAALGVVFTLPRGATISPAIGTERDFLNFVTYTITAQDFSNGPVTYTITAQDGTTKAPVKVQVAIASPPLPTEQEYFSELFSECEIGYEENADGSITAYLRIPFGVDVDPDLIDQLLAILRYRKDYHDDDFDDYDDTSAVEYGTLSLYWVDASGNITPIKERSARSASVKAPYLQMKGNDVDMKLTYEYVDASGNTVPIKARSARIASVKAPYLQIKFTASSLEALKKGSLEKINYRLKGDTTEYVQTFANGGLKFSGIKITDETPAGGNDTGDSGGHSSGDCDTGAFGLFGAAAIALIALKRREKY
jgi:hypothetical protein